MAGERISTMNELRDALEHICRHADPEKLELRKGKDGMWKLGLGLHITAVEAHHVMTVMEVLEATAELPFVPNLAGKAGRPAETKMGF